MDEGKIKILRARSVQTVFVVPNYRTAANYVNQARRDYTELLDEIELLRKVLQAIQEIADDDIRQERGFGTGIYQIEADARAALGIEIRS